MSVCCVAFPALTGAEIHTTHNRDMIKKKKKERGRARARAHTFRRKDKRSERTDGASRRYTANECRRRVRSKLAVHVWGVDSARRWWNAIDADR